MSILSLGLFRHPLADWAEERWIHGWGKIALTMKPENWIALISAVWTVIALFVGPRWAVNQSLRQFQSTKWWERQLDVYNSALENLAVLKHHYVSELDGITNPAYMPGANALVSAELEKATAKLQQIAAVGPYYLSHAASDKLTACLFSIGIEYGLGEENALTMQSRTVTECLDVVRTEANKIRDTSFGRGGALSRP